MNSPILLIPSKYYWMGDSLFFIKQNNLILLLLIGIRYKIFNR